MTEVCIQWFDSLLNAIDVRWYSAKIQPIGGLIILEPGA